MNILTSSSYALGSRRSATRAHLSPLLRRTAQAAFIRRQSRAPLTFDRLFNPRLLDRLQVPLTRFHD